MANRFVWFVRLSGSLAPRSSHHDLITHSGPHITINTNPSVAVCGEHTLIRVCVDVCVCVGLCGLARMPRELSDDDGGIDGDCGGCGFGDDVDVDDDDG